MTKTDNTTQYAECQSAINNSVRQFIESQSNIKAKVVPSCSLRITFYHRDFQKLVIDSFSQITGKLELVCGDLVAIFPNETEARNVSNSLYSIIHAYNSELLETPFKNGWLSSYLRMESMGINCTMADSHIQSLQQAEKILSSKKDSIENQQYEERRSIVRNNISDYTFEKLTNDVTNFIIDNFYFKRNESDVISILNDVFDSFKSVALGKHGLDNLHHVKTINALENKSEFIQLSANRSDIHNQVLMIREMGSQLSAANKQKEQTKIRYDEILNAIQPILVNLFSSSTAKPDYTEFNGLDLMYSSPYEWKYLSAKLLPNFIETYNDDIGKALSALLTSFLISFVVEVSTFKMKLMLNELSDQLDTKSFHSEYQNLVKLCSPFPSNNGQHL